ncbi:MULTISPECIES: caspase, EACC1-associated type [Frankia]|uniref:caspase, EACC1-associated type n=1 Tax=Frankia TaxID=1854 RepID=UPI000317D9B9|nr:MULTISPECIES: AAA domain-containing protein [Frankia]
MNRPSRRRALLIGVADYIDGHFGPLPCVHEDLRQLADVLEHRTIGGFEPVQVITDPTADEMRLAIDDFLGSAGPDDLALLYVSGHGVRDVAGTGEFFFITHDSDHANVGAQTTVSATFVNDQLESCRAPQKIAILDCCLSGGFAMGFRTQEAKSGGSASAAPLTSRGVYVLSSSGPGENSYAGPVGAHGQAPSVFTGELVEALRTGAADHDGDGRISVDELFDHVNSRLRLRDGATRQIPVKSAIGVNGRIVVADNPRTSAARSRQPGPATAPTADRAANSGGDPRRQPDGWVRLLDYYRACLRGESAGGIYELRAASPDYVCLRGRERFLSGDADDEGYLPVPPEAAELVARVHAEGGELVAGYPMVVLAPASGARGRRKPQVAPLLTRRVEIVQDGSGWRLKLDSVASPDPTLAREVLGEQEAADLLTTYQATWHAGQPERLAAEARHLLLNDYALAVVQELQPLALEEHIDVRTPVVGARNVAALLRAPQDTATRKLLDDLQYISAHSSQIAETALDALRPDSAPAPPAGSAGAAPAVRLVTPWQSNDAQRSVLHSAMTSRVTVATGPPGTGKSQLVANLVATAVANGQRVLVASTNNRAVDEVWERCENELPGLLVRTGSASGPTNNRQRELQSLKELRNRATPHQTPTTCAIRLDLARSAETTLHDQLAGKARLEQDLLDLTEEQGRVAGQLHVDSAGLAQRLGSEAARWAAQAARTAKAWFFGKPRRSRLLTKLGVDGEPTAERCALVAQFADLESRRAGLLASLEGMPVDSGLLTDLRQREHDVLAASRELVEVDLGHASAAGQRAIDALLQTAPGRPDWSELRAVLPYVRGWAVTALSARRFPTAPGLFDLVIVDEASQCSIPAVLPLLFRAKRALIIGDAMQLPHIATLPPAKEGKIRAEAGLDADWLADRCLSYLRYSSFHAFDRTVEGASLLLDEHYRCHPAIAGLANRLFYADRLTVLTNVRAQRSADMDPLCWVDVAGRAENPADGSWLNRAEIDAVNDQIALLLGKLPPTGTIGVVTPFRAQSAAISTIWAAREPERVKVGTVHTFQGGERDAMVFSLVAADGIRPGTASWLEQQANLWNVAITRARSHLIVVGDSHYWHSRGGLGGSLLAAAQQGPGTTQRDAVADAQYEYRLRLAELLAVTYPQTAAQFGQTVGGYPADAVVTTSTGQTAMLLDRGHGTADPARHLRVQLARTALLSDPNAGRSGLRVAAWQLPINEGRLTGAP